MFCSSVQGGFPITSIREIRILRSLTHDNIVELLEVVTDSHGKVEDGKVCAQYLQTVNRQTQARRGYRYARSCLYYCIFIGFLQRCRKGAVSRTGIPGMPDYNEARWPTIAALLSTALLWWLYHLTSGEGAWVVIITTTYRIPVSCKVSPSPTIGPRSTGVIFLGVVRGCYVECITPTRTLTHSEDGNMAIFENTNKCVRTDCTRDASAAR